MTQRSQPKSEARKRSGPKVLGRSAATGGVILAPKTKPTLLTVREIARVVRDVSGAETADLCADRPVKRMP